MKISLECNDIIRESRARFGESNRSETRAIRRLNWTRRYQLSRSGNREPEFRVRLVLTGMLYSRMRYALS